MQLSRLGGGVSVLGDVLLLQATWRPTAGGLQPSDRCSYWRERCVLLSSFSGPWIWGKMRASMVQVCLRPSRRKTAWWVTKPGAGRTDKQQCGSRGRRNSLGRTQNAAPRKTRLAWLTLPDVNSQWMGSVFPLVVRVFPGIRGDHGAADEIRQDRRTADC